MIVSDHDVLPIAGKTGELRSVAISLLKVWRSEVTSLEL